MKVKTAPEIQLSTLAHIAMTLTAAELRTASYLAAAQDSEHCTIAKVAQLANATGQRVSTVQRALTRLRRRNLIVTNREADYHRSPRREIWV
jgi:DNA-binding MarR family transcriptional regulator